MSYVEGMLYVMRRIIIFAHDRGEIELELGEAVLIREISFAFNTSKKRVTSRENSNRILENFILTFRLLPKAFGSAFKIDYGNDGWEKISESR